jgi:hypothetical protein
MQIKHYTVLEHADISVIQAWADEPNNHCTLITQGRVGSVTHSLCVRQPLGHDDVIAPMETHLSGMIEETAWPE